MYKIVQLPQYFRDGKEQVLQVFVRVSTLHSVIQHRPEPSIHKKRPSMGVVVVFGVPDIFYVVLWIDALH
jgi:hypothetical protein